jgi:hypothetical protein
MNKSNPPELLKKEIHVALRHYHSVGEPPDNQLANLVLVQSIKQKQRAYSKRLCINAVLDKGLTQLEFHNLEGAKILKKRFIDGKKIPTVSHALNLSIDQVKHKQKDALKEIANTIWHLEQEARKFLVTDQKSKLVAEDYTALFGIDSLFEELFAHLTANGSPWVVTLVGIGGIGKTSLANFTVRKVIEQLHYHDVVWLKISDLSRRKRPYPSPSPQQTFERLIAELCQKMLPALSIQTRLDERLSHLQQLLKSQPYLIIIDDLELQSETAYLLSELVTLATPSRFLLTSRVRPAHHAGSQSICLPELNKEYSLALIRHYAREIGFTLAVDAQDEELLPIFELVGGNPFCLKHLINLAVDRPLEPLLVSLRKRPLENDEKMYKHILHETWLSLSDDAKTVLAIMTLATEGGLDPEDISRLSGLSDAKLWPAINELIGRSLLEVRSNSVWERHYGIHRLTELFLRSLMGGDNSEDESEDDGL